MIPHPFQALARSREILALLLRHGFGELVERTGIPVPAVLKRESAPSGEPCPTPLRLRRVLEQLGPTFIKFGQVLSTRPDLVAPEYLEEFAKLQDRVPPLPFAAVAAVVQAELGREPAALFREFAVEPVAAASLAQVHRAVLADGTPVAVKIQRPHIRDQIRADLDLLTFLARLLEEHIPEVHHYQPTRIIDEFRYTLQRELDFTIELRAIKRFHAQFRSDPDLVIPQPYPEFSSPRVLTMAYLPGHSLAECFTAPPEERRRLAAIGLTAFLKQLFVHGYFHADPHPGNMRVLPDGRLALVDFGMVGRVLPELKFKLAALVEAVLGRDYEEIATLVLELSETRTDIDRTRLVRDIADTVDDYYSEQLSDLRTGAALQQLIALALTYRLRLPATLALMVKCLLTIEAVGRALDPELNVVAAVRPHLRDLLLERYSTARAVDLLFRTLREFTRLTAALPHDLRQILTKLQHGRLSLDFRHRNLEQLTASLDHASNRVAFALIIAALIVGSSLLVAAGGAAYPWFGLVGYLIAMLFGIWLLILIIRSGNL
ncbi:MAG TPA: AarF/ABC1/UbiB kinase family protein [bacterium]|nr:AarF/ABC1/UbiB kinase family protein [bacterium]